MAVRVCLKVSTRLHVDTREQEGKHVVHSWGRGGQCALAARPCFTPVMDTLCRWRSKIDPVLKDEEGRSNFDIQMYGERIIKRLQQATAQPDEVRGRCHV